MVSLPPYTKLQAGGVQTIIATQGLVMHRRVDKQPAERSNGGFQAGYCGGVAAFQRPAHSREMRGLLQPPTRGCGPPFKSCRYSMPLTS